jgi:hypothetical protein
MASGSERDPGRRASTELPLYGVEGWPGQRQVGSSLGIARTGRGGEKAVLMSVGVNHNHGDTSITVTSHRRQDNGLASLRQWVSQNAIRAMLREHADYESGQLVISLEADRLQSAARLDKLPWENVTIPVDGQPTPFQLYVMQDGCAPALHLRVGQRRRVIVNVAEERAAGYSPRSADFMTIRRCS